MKYIVHLINKCFNGLFYDQNQDQALYITYVYVYIYVNVYTQLHILHAPLESKIQLLKMELKSSLIIDHSEKSILGRVL